MNHPHMGIPVNLNHSWSWMFGHHLWTALFTLSSFQFFCFSNYICVVWHISVETRIFLGLLRLGSITDKWSLRSVSHSILLPSPWCECLSFYPSNLDFSFLYAFYFCQHFAFALADLTCFSHGILSFPYKYSFWKYCCFPNLSWFHCIYLPPM